MRSAKHRFESLQKPLGRTVLFTYPCIRTALWITVTRSDQAAVNAKEWLEYVDNENCLQAAMMGDASDQTMALTRLMDDEEVDAAILNHEVKQYVRTIDFLFGHEAKCLTTFGYTQATVQTLEKPLVWMISGKSFHIGGGVPGAVIERCLDRMRCWVKIMKSTLAVEFPSFEIACVWALVEI